LSAAVPQEGSDRHGEFGRRSVLRVALAGGNAAQRAAVKDVIIHVREVETEIVDLGDEAPVAEIDPKIGLLALLLDVANQAQLPMNLLPANSNGLAPLTVALLAERSSQLIQSALRSGADDVLALPPGYEDTLRVLLRAGEARRRAVTLTPDRKKVCSLVSMSGGRGISSLTLCLGFAIMRLLEKRVVLVDLDLQAAPLSVLLDIEPEHSIADLADPTSPIDSIRLESVLSKDHAGPSLLAAPKRIEQAELVSATTVEAALKVLHDLFDVVLIDCGSHLNESSVVVFEHSEHLLYVLDQSIIAVRAAQRFLTLYESLELRTCQPHIIVNRYRPGDIVTLQAIEAALHLPIFATIPNEETAFKDRQTMGRDLWNISAGANARRSFEHLARKLFASPTLVTTKSGLFSRLLAGIAKARGVEHGTHR
jgi:Flp pilus assembly CpaE family ATPase